MTEPFRVSQELVEVEVSLAGWARYRADSVRRAEEAGRSSRTATVWLIIGLFLIPVLAGLIVAPVALVAMLNHNGRRANALRCQAWADRQIEALQARAAYLRAWLSVPVLL